MRIPGLEQALSEERRLREEAYLSANTSICGVPIKQLTPWLLIILTSMGTPYLNGDGLISEAETMRFIWALHPENPYCNETCIYDRLPKSLGRWFRSYYPLTKRDKFLAGLPKSGFDVEKAEDEIWEYLKATFLDAPQGKSSTPYCSGVAWIEYSMSAKPFGWHRTYTLDQPLRVIYQLIRCRALDNGATLVNELSDRLRGNYLAQMQKAMESMSDEEKVAYINRVNTGGLN